MARNKKNVLDKLSPGELTSVVRTLLSRHPELESEVEAIAIEAVSDPSVEDIADDVFDILVSLGIDALHGRAGKRPWGYVEPSEAAWELLEESVEDVVADMKRHMDLGLLTAAETICCGIVAGFSELTASVRMACSALRRISQRSRHVTPSPSCSGRVL